MQVLIEHGHSKEVILKEYSREEVELFYEKCVKQDMRKMADRIESTAAGIGMSFSKSNKMSRIIKELRE